MTQSHHCVQLGPLFVAKLITDVGGRSRAFNLSVLGWLLNGVINSFVFFFVSTDERRVQMDLQASMGKYESVHTEEDRENVI